MIQDNRHVIVALDFASAEDALAMARRLDPALCRVKVGKELFTASGPALVRQLVSQGFDVFLDLKFHDIPNTVARACEAAAAMGVWMLNVHAGGGSAMMRAAREGVQRGAAQAGRATPLLIAVTVLTSLTSAELREVGINDDALVQAERLAKLACDAGLNGVVCSVHEVAAIKRQCGAGFLTVTPGIRFAEDDKGDQARIATPQLAAQMGSDYLVIGRPITQASDPHERLRAVNQVLRETRGSKV